MCEMSSLSGDSYNPYAAEFTPANGNSLPLLTSSLNFESAKSTAASEPDTLHLPSLSSESHWEPELDGFVSMADRMKASSTMIVRSQSQSSQIGENPTLNIKKAPVEKNLERPLKTPAPKDVEKVKFLEEKVARMERLFEEERQARQKLEASLNLSKFQVVPPPVIPQMNLESQGQRQDSLASRMSVTGSVTPGAFSLGGGSFDSTGGLVHFPSGLEVWEDVSAILREKRQARKVAEQRVASLCEGLMGELAHLGEARTEEERVCDEMLSWTLNLISRIHGDVGTTFHHLGPQGSGPSTSAWPKEGPPQVEPSRNLPQIRVKVDHESTANGTSGTAEDLFVQGKDEGGGARLASQYYKGGTVPACGPHMGENLGLKKIDEELPNRDEKLQNILKELQGLRVEITSKLAEQKGEEKGQERVDIRGKLGPPIVAFAPPPLSRNGVKEERKRALEKLEVSRDVHIVELEKSQFPPTRANSGNLSPLVKAPSSYGSAF